MRSLGQDPAEPSEGSVFRCSATVQVPRSPTPARLLSLYIATSSRWCIHAGAQPLLTLSFDLLSLGARSAGLQFRRSLPQETCLTTRPWKLMGTSSQPSWAAGAIRLFTWDLGVRVQEVSGLMYHLD